MRPKVTHMRLFASTTLPAHTHKRAQLVKNACHMPGGMSKRKKKKKDDMFRMRGTGPAACALRFSRLRNALVVRTTPKKLTDMSCRERALHSAWRQAMMRKGVRHRTNLLIL